MHIYQMIERPKMLLELRRANEIDRVVRGPQCEREDLYRIGSRGSNIAFVLINRNVIRR